MESYYYYVEEIARTSGHLAEQISLQTAGVNTARNESFMMIPQIATPLTLHDLRAGISGFFTRQDLSKEFEMKLRQFTGSRFCYTASSGRAALYLILETLKRLSGKREVVIPVYTCPIVAYIIAKAGLDIVLCDIEKTNFGLDPTFLNKVTTDNTLCVIPTHLFGLPCRLEEIKEVVDTKKVWMIEDAAQATGATLNGAGLGTIGDFGVLSLGAGKSFTPAGGGAILTQKVEWAHEIEQTTANRLMPNFWGVTRSLVTLLFYALLIHPRFFGIIKDIVIRMEEADQLQDFDVLQLSNCQAALAISILERLRVGNEVRARNARALIEALSENISVVTPKIPENSQPTFLRLPIMVQNAEQREKVYRRLEESGIQARKPFNTLMNQLEGISAVNGTSSFPGAEYVVNRILTLPTHPFVNEKERNAITQAFSVLR